MLEKCNSDSVCPYAAIVPRIANSGISELRFVGRFAVALTHVSVGPNRIEEIVDFDRRSGLHRGCMSFLCPAVLSACRATPSRPRIEASWTPYWRGQCDPWRFVDHGHLNYMNGTRP